MISIKLKLISLYIGLVFLVMIVSSTFILLTVRNNESDMAEQDLIFYTTLINDEIINQVNSPNDFDIALKTLFSSNQSNNNVSPVFDYHSVILSGDGSSILASTDTLENASIPVIISAVNGIDSFSAWRSDSDSNGFLREWFEYAYPSSDYIIYTRTDASKSSESVYNMARTLLISVIIALILAGFLGYLLSSTITTPIIMLTNKAKELANGNLDEELRVYSNDEIGQLTESFNYMIRELKYNIESILTEKNKFEVILHSMSDGVLAYDSSGTVIHGNNASNELLDINANRYNLDKLMSNFNIPFNKKDFNGKKEITIAISDKFISININHYKNYSDDTEGTLIVLQDITKHKKLDNMRKEFVANVSHELRTPLTTVKSYTETIIDNDIDDKETLNNFLSVINSEVDRMTFLVTDLLDLSRFDNNKMILNMKNINLFDIISHTIKQNNILATNKNQEINFYHDNNAKLIINGDKDRIMQVFNNILSNAIKYSPDNSTINISTKSDDKYHTIYIRDNGIGIPKNDLKRIFERFYRVDKARSRSLGGVGLGLSITKEIITAHNGKIEAQSKIDQGTTIIVSFLKV